MVTNKVTTDLYTNFITNNNIYMYCIQTLQCLNVAFDMIICFMFKINVFVYYTKMDPGNNEECRWASDADDGPTLTL